MKLNKDIIGMVHVGALPGTPKNSGKVREILSKALFEARILQNAGVDVIMIENMHDRPYLNKKTGPEIVSSMSVIAAELKQKLQMPMGIQILAGANKEALAVALAAELDFIRAEGFVFGHLADEGWMNSDAAKLLRYRKQIGAEHITIFTDIKKKHSSHVVTSDISIADTAKAAEFFLSDGIIVTGDVTGQKPSADEVQEVKKVTLLPVIIGSGIDLSNITEFWNIADAFIVGSYFKNGGEWQNEMDAGRVNNFMQKINQLRH